MRIILLYITVEYGNCFLTPKIKFCLVTQKFLSCIVWIRPHGSICNIRSVCCRMPMKVTVIAITNYYVATFQQRYLVLTVQWEPFREWLLIKLARVLGQPFSIKWQPVGVTVFKWGIKLGQAEVRQVSHRCFMCR